MASDLAPTGTASAALCWIAYATAAFAGFCTLELCHDQTMDPLIAGAVASVVATLVVFVFSLLTRNTSVYDPYWVLAPCGLTAYWLVTAPKPVGWYALGCSALIFVWAIRFMVAIPWPGWTRGIDHEDWRYLHMRDKLGASPWIYWSFSLLSLHLTPTFLVYLALAPLHRIIVDHELPGPLGDGTLNLALRVGALSFTACAIVYEGFADYQLRSFRKSQLTDEESILDRGLWSLSRHPNYFGECSFWLGIAGLAVAGGHLSLHREPWLALGCAVMFAFFRFASVPLMDARSLSRRPGYARLMRELPAMLPRLSGTPPRGGAK